MLPWGKKKKKKKKMINMFNGKDGRIKVETIICRHWNLTLIFFKVRDGKDLVLLIIMNITRVYHSILKLWAWLNWLMQGLSSNLKYKSLTIFVHDKSKYKETENKYLCMKEYEYVAKYSSPIIADKNKAKQICRWIVFTGL